MKYLRIFTLLLAVSTISCSDDDDTPFEGREVRYELEQMSGFPVAGEVIFTELEDGALSIALKLVGTSGDAMHPVHLHQGDISNPDAPMALGLNSLDASTGESVTVVTKLMSEESFGYDDLLMFEGSIKVHLGDSGDDKKVVLAGGNVGALGQPVSGE